ncbi:MAG: OmpA family protein [Rhodobacter sp.]|nr:OmpA family protein [Paracoccaceae bacterium]MCB1408467.1 OmpA family protein [Paracoccaceae bacterium]MCC0081004.1 OmpA family protein [Rhodobacter sp.]
MTAKKAILAVSALALVAACTQTDGQLDRRRTGALAGGVIGGLVGAANGGNNSTPEVLIGAGLGALAGGAIGGVLDRQAGELRQSLGPDVGVVNTGNEIVVTMPQDILFATDSASLRPDLQSDLRTIAANLQRYPDSIVVVTGHTDSTGTAAHNQALSERRADAVASVLISSGVPARRIQAVGAGQTQPIASNGTASGRAQNRRVEITIRPTN